MSVTAKVAIIGAGPYGVSLAAHLRASNVPHVVFGRPMMTWVDHMPAGMFLKSDGFASSLSDPERRLTLKTYCQDRGIAYRDVGLPVSRRDFTDYALDFQRRMAPGIDETYVTALDRTRDGFALQLADGRTAQASAVVVAAGLEYFRQVPALLAQPGSAHVTHSADHGPVDGFRGREVLVIGAGASAIDLAIELTEKGAQVSLVARRRSIRFQDRIPEPRTLWRRARRPASPIGLGWRSQLISDAPMLFRYLPKGIRVRTVTGYLRPTPAWFTEERIVGRVPMHLGASLRGAEMQGERVVLRICDHTGAEQEISADHLIAATGYNLDVRRLPFLSSEILNTLRLLANAPVLGSDFQSSVPGLFFVGPLAANSFGPPMRFVVGAAFASRRVNRQLSGLAPRVRPQSRQGRGELTTPTVG